MKPGNLKVPTPCHSIDFAGLPPDICDSVGDVLARIGDKWSILVVYMLSRGRMRFNEIKKSIGSISQKVLTTTLRGLERDGFITRQVTPSRPPRVDYELTAFGRDLLVPVVTLATWAFSRRHEVEAARAAFDQRSAAADSVPLLSSGRAGLRERIGNNCEAEDDAVLLKPRHH